MSTCPNVAVAPEHSITALLGTSSGGGGSNNNNSNSKGGGNGGGGNNNNNNNGSKGGGSGGGGSNNNDGSKKGGGSGSSGSTRGGNAGGFYQRRPMEHLITSRPGPGWAGAAEPLERPTTRGRRDRKLAGSRRLQGTGKKVCNRALSFMCRQIKVESCTTGP